MDVAVAVAVTVAAAVGADAVAVVAVAAVANVAASDAAADLLPVAPDELMVQIRKITTAKPCGSIFI